VNNIPFRKGTSINLVITMLLLFLFSIAALALALSAAKAFRDIEADKRRISELMVALSYLNMKIRQNDCENAIHIEPNPSGEGQAIVITEVLDSVAYETWMYLQDGELREGFVLKGDEVTRDTSSLIVEIDGFDVAFEQPCGKSPKIKISIWRNGQGEQRDLALSLSLRASPGNGL